MAIVENRSGQAYTYVGCDEAEGTDSSFCTTCSSPYTRTVATTDSWFFLNNSTGIHITPGTAVQLTEPGHIIPVRSMDDIRSQPTAPRQTATEARMLHEVALARAQAGVVSRMGIGAAQQQGARTFAQQPAVLNQQNLERAVEQLSGVSRMEMGVPRSPVSGAEQRCAAERQQRSVSDQELGRLYGRQREIPRNPAEMYEEACRDLGEFPIREPEPPDENIIPPRPTPVPSEEYLAHEKKREEAEERAHELLGYMIGEKDLEVYKKTGRLFVGGKKHEYIIQKNGYVIQIKKDKVIDLCVHLEKRYAMPLTDNTIAMKLMIENGEKEMLKLANTWGERDRETYMLPECAGMV